MPRKQSPGKSTDFDKEDNVKNLVAGHLSADAERSAIQILIWSTKKFSQLQFPFEEINEFIKPK